MQENAGSGDDKSTLLLGSVLKDIDGCEDKVEVENVANHFCLMNRNKTINIYAGFFSLHVNCGLCMCYTHEY